MIKVQPEQSDLSSDDLRQLVAAARQIARLMDVQSRRIDREVGLTLPQLIVLQCIGDLGEVTSRTVAATAGMSPPQVVGILDKLEAKRLIHRYRSTVDRRVVHTGLTEKGTTILKAAPEPLGERFASRFLALPAERRAAILAALAMVSDLAADDIEPTAGGDDMIAGTSPPEALPR